MAYQFIRRRLFIRAKLRGTTDNGPLEGAVRRIGWNDRLIVAQRAANSGGTLAWMIVDTKTETLEGPFTDEEFKEKVKATPELAAIRIDSAASAWEALQ